MSMNIFLPALPEMAAEFGTSYGVMQLAVALYLVTNAALQILLGPLSDRFGRRPVMLATFAVYILATLGCIAAPSAEAFLACRMVQAVVFSGVILARAMVRDMYPREEAASKIGYVTFFMAMVPMVSPAIGGVLGAAFGWRASFWLLAVLGLGVLWLIWRDVGETHLTRSASLREQVRQYPELFASPRFWGYAMTAALCGGTYFSYLGGAPFVGSVVFGLEPTVLGLVLGSTALGYATGNFLSGRFSMRVGVDRMVLGGTLVVSAALCVSLALLATGIGSAWSFFALMVPVGIGNGMMLPNATSGFLSVRPHLAGTASGLGGALMIGGGAALAAFVGVWMTPQNGALLLVSVQTGAALASVLTIVFTIRRARRLGLG